MTRLQQVSLEGFRCFRDYQEVPIAPLTLLVGENSTGKTSFLGLIKALSRLGNPFPISQESRVFSDEVFDLGGFEGIAHHRGGRGSQSTRFGIGCSAPSASGNGNLHNGSFESYYTFTEDHSRLQMSAFEIAHEGVNFRIQMPPSGSAVVMLDAASGSFEWCFDSGLILSRLRARNINPRQLMLHLLWEERDPRKFKNSGLLRNSGDPSVAQTIQGTLKQSGQASDLIRQDFDHLKEICEHLERASFPITVAAAPVRAKPQRTYDHTSGANDPEGANIPTYLARLATSNSTKWKAFQRKLEQFGQDSGLFDEIGVRSLGANSRDPFQLVVRKFGAHLKGPKRNVVDVGSGVGQVLSTVTELLKPDQPSLHLLQQPEVHLHPSAQAALGSLFCKLASADRQLVVETHSDYLIDRIRMNIRDKNSELQPENVALLFFEQRELAVRIHSLKFDREGNILGAPVGYRKFFIEETQRSLGI